MSDYDQDAITRAAMTAKADPWPKPVPNDAPLVDRLRYRIEYGDLLASGDCDPQIYTVAEEALEELERLGKIEAAAKAIEDQIDAEKYSEEVALDDLFDALHATKKDIPAENVRGILG